MDGGNVRGKLEKYIGSGPRSGWPGTVDCYNLIVTVGNIIGGAQELKILMKGVECFSCVFTGRLQQVHCHESAWHRPSKHNRLCYS